MESVTQKPNESRLQKLYLVLCAVFLSNAILAEMIGVKIFSLEKLLGTAPAQLSRRPPAPADGTTGVSDCYVATA